MWSFSRYRTFQECRRRYWLNYHAARLGETPDAPERFREVYTQKYLLSRPQWVGNVVHDVAQEALESLRDGLALDAGAAAAKALARANEEVNASEEGRWREEPREQPGFQEHYYKSRPWEAWPVTLGDISELVRALYDHAVFRRIVEVPERLVEIEELVEVELRGVPTRVRLDVLIDDGDGGKVVIDWKTGRSHRAEVVRDQLAVYGLYVQEKYKQTSRGMYANVRLNNWGLYDLDDELLDRVAAFIQGSYDEMQAADPDPAAVEESEENFSKIPVGSRQCRWCAFRRDCGRG